MNARNCWELLEELLGTDEGLLNSVIMRGETQTPL